MITVKEFPYKPGEHECERASNSYLMSLVAIMAGLPFPIINFIASIFFWLGNKKASYFVRWHCIQVLFSVVSLLIVNSISVYWTLSIAFGEGQLTNLYISYIITAIICNLIEYILTFISAIKTRKGIHVEWWFFGPLTNMISKP